MVVALPIHRRITGLLLASFGRNRRDAGRRSPQARVGIQLEGLEERCLLSITEFPLPAYPNGGTGPAGIAAGPDGNLWFGMTYNGGYIGMISPTTDAITEFPLDNVSDFAEGIAAGPDGNVWFTGYNSVSAMMYIGQISPTTHSFSEFALHSADVGNGTPRAITAGPDGNLWFTDPYANAVGTISPTTHAITEFALPTAGADPEGITTGADGNLWFTEAGAGKIGMIEPTTHVITEFVEPTASSSPYFEGITAGPDGNLWFAERAANQIGEFNATTHVITEFATPYSGSEPVGITAGSDGDVWFTEASADQVGEINPTTREITEFTVPYGGSTPNEMTTGPDGNVWFTAYSPDTPPAAIGVVTPGVVNPDVGILTGPLRNPANGHDYYLLTQSNWTDAEAEAVKLGGHLATIDNAAENAWVVSNFSEFQNVDRSLWIGLTDQAVEGTFVWTSGEPVAYTNWAAGEPNNSGGDENWVQILPSSDSRYPGWNDAPNLAGPFGFVMNGVVEVDPSHLAVTQQPPASVRAGTSFGLTVQAEDSSGNLDSSFNGSVTVALANNPGGATLGGMLSATASNGVATFSDLTLTTAATGYTLEISGMGVDSTTTSAITVSPAAATQLAITQQPPASVIVNKAFGLQATIEDPYGNVETGDNAALAVALANNPGGATLGGTLGVNANLGVADFTALTLDSVGSGYTLQVSGDGLASATTNGITVTPVPATKLVITQEPPAGVIAGTSFGLTVQAEDNSGDFASTFSGSVTVALEATLARRRSAARSR